MAKQAATKKRETPENTENAKVQTSEPQLPSTSEPDSPDPFSADFVKEAMRHKKKIDSEFARVEKSSFAIAFELHWFYDNEGFKPLGYVNVYDFARDAFNIARGTTCNYINMIDRFGERDGLGNFTGKISEKYKDFSSSKLILMLNLTDDELDRVRPDMSVRELKKEISLIMDRKTEHTETADRKPEHTETADRKPEHTETTDRKPEHTETTDGNTDIFKYTEMKDFVYDCIAGLSEQTYLISGCSVASITNFDDYSVYAAEIDGLIHEALKSGSFTGVEIILTTSGKETVTPEGKGDG